MKKIMFNEPYGLQQATFDGSKTMTRRIVPDVILNYVPIYQQQYYEQTLSTISVEDAIMNMVGPEKMFQRYVYQVGEVVAIAQRYEDLANGGYLDRMLDGPLSMKKEYTGAGYKNKMFVKPELMPHHIKITSRRLEHLQDISEVDCLREGIIFDTEGGKIIGYPFGIPFYYTFKGCVSKKTGKQVYYNLAREAFSELIDRTSRKGTWDSNPLVFVYEYERID